ncbi:hypothetical protein ERJ75_000303200 [Trypanosoma vivax]|uniref:Mucin-associated surface protein (MASP) n=1 Tax=Trypanosoma vivax (strain Y486) TaxID=1055687 RepID=F9WU34_TRYVY|nr:hypothetical protein TRVL_08235 [Trypanosoma vivax]KAH8618175.1 hypothetical protein ERJ75_000303200 [Trypanosoma vivax]CCD21081.1 hypothetical protein, conserved in T.vivax [Trypanosoma vivax Y486]|eukprot:CCD21081.1 hypothetical protein, conserved in T.vivax [Trypanosoma vivax Y486]
MVLFFRCVFLALLGVAALGDKGAESTRTTRTNSRLVVLTRHRGGEKHPRIQPRSFVTPGQEGVNASSSSGSAVQTTVGDENTSLNNVTVPPPTEKTEVCKCDEDKGEEVKKECESECKKKESKSKSPSKSMKEIQPSESPLQGPGGQLQQEGQVNVQGEAQQVPENGKGNKGDQSSAAGSPASGSDAPKTPNSKPGTTQESSLSEKKPGEEAEKQDPQNSDKQLGSTNNDESAKGNADKTESNGDTSEKEKAESNDEAKGGRDRQESTHDSSEGRNGKDGSAGTSSAIFSGKTLTVLLLAILACFGAW